MLSLKHFISSLVRKKFQPEVEQPLSPKKRFRVILKSPLKQLTKKQLRLLSRWSLAFVAVFAVLAFDGQRGRAELLNKVEYSNSRHDYSFINPVVKRILLANPHNEELALNTALIRDIVRYADDACFRTTCDTALLLAIFRVEADYRPGAKNKRSSASGLGQTLSFWQKELVADRLCTMPSQVISDQEYLRAEIEDAAHVLVYYKAKARGDWARALNGYKGGDSLMWHPDTETREYTQDALRHYRALSI